MRRWPVALSLVLGLALGVAGTILGPRLAGPYLPEWIRGKAERIEGTVIRKQWEKDRLLLSVESPQGAILATFTERVAEVDLLVDRGDTLTLVVARYEPFVQDPEIARVQKHESAAGTEGPTAPSPAAGGGAPRESP